MKPSCTTVCKWQLSDGETRQQQRRVRSSHQIRCFLVSLHFQCEIQILHIFESWGWDTLLLLQSMHASDLGSGCGIFWLHAARLSPQLWYTRAQARRARGPQGRPRDRRRAHYSLGGRIPFEAGGLSHQQGFPTSSRICGYLPRLYIL